VAAGIEQEVHRAAVDAGGDRQLGEGRRGHNRAGGGHVVIVGLARRRIAVRRRTGQQAIAVDDDPLFIIAIGPDDREGQPPPRDRAIIGITRLDPVEPFLFHRARQVAGRGVEPQFDRLAAGRGCGEHRIKPALVGPDDRRRAPCAAEPGLQPAEPGEPRAGLRPPLRERAVELVAAARSIDSPVRAAVENLGGGERLQVGMGGEAAIPQVGDRMPAALKPLRRNPPGRDQGIMGLPPARGGASDQQQRRAADHPFDLHHAPLLADLWRNLNCLFPADAADIVAARAIASGATRTSDPDNARLLPSQILR
jgi:hypothetical protein